MNPLYNLIAFLLLGVPFALSAGPRFIFSFGDSYTGTPFKIDGNPPQPSNPMGNPATGSGTSCDVAPSTICENWIETLTLNLSAVNTLTYNFAQGGSVINNKHALNPGAWYNLTTQVAQWTGSIAGKPFYAPWTASNSVAFYWFGVNDLSSISGGTTNYKSDIGLDLNDLFTNLQWMYNYGVRRFIILNAPPYTKNPSFNGVKNLNYINGNISYWNSVLPGLSSDFASKNSGSVVKVIDTNTPFNKILSDPNKYPKPWADYLHPAKDIQDQVAQSAYSVLKGLNFYV